MERLDLKCVACALVEFFAFEKAFRLETWNLVGF